MVDVPSREEFLLLQGQIESLLQTINELDVRLSEIEAELPQPVKDAIQVIYNYIMGIQ